MSQFLLGMIFKIKNVLAISIFLLVPADANESVKSEVKFILNKNGGSGALTELINLIYK